MHRPDHGAGRIAASGLALLTLQLTAHRNECEDPDRSSSMSDLVNQEESRASQQDTTPFAIAGTLQNKPNAWECCDQLNCAFYLVRQVTSHAMPAFPRRYFAL